MTVLLVICLAIIAVGILLGLLFEVGIDENSKVLGAYVGFIWGSAIAAVVLCLGVAWHFLAKVW